MIAMTSISVYDAMVLAGVQIDHHESDLYVPDNAVTRAILEHYPDHRAQPFMSENEPWLDIPFAYQPWWELRLHRAQRVWLYRVRGAQGVATHAHTRYVDLEGFEFLSIATPREMTRAQLDGLKELPVPRTDTTEAKG